MRVDMDAQVYQSYVKRMQMKSAGQGMACFVIGGHICVGDRLTETASGAGLNTEGRGTDVGVPCNPVGAVTGTWDFNHRLARFGGAGTLCNHGLCQCRGIPAWIFMAEGFVHGWRHKFTSLRGPVIGYGTWTACVGRCAVGVRAWTPWQQAFGFTMLQRLPAPLQAGGTSSGMSRGVLHRNLETVLRADSSGESTMVRWWMRKEAVGTLEIPVEPMAAMSGPCTRGRPQRREVAVVGRTM